jgi:hypothetical protein
MDQHYVEKVPLRVTINVALKNEYVGEIFLNYAPQLSLIERLRNFFHGYSYYIPFKLESGNVMMIKKQSIAYLKFSGSRNLNTKATQDVGPFITLRKKAEIFLQNSQSIKGTVVKDKMQTHNRLLDCLNKTEDIFLIESNEYTYILPHTFIDWVRDA